MQNNIQKTTKLYKLKSAYNGKERLTFIYIGSLLILVSFKDNAIVPHS